MTTPASSLESLNQLLIALTVKTNQISQALASAQEQHRRAMDMANDLGLRGDVIGLMQNGFESLSALALKSVDVAHRVDIARIAVMEGPRSHD